MLHIKWFLLLTVKIWIVSCFSVTQSSGQSVGVTSRIRTALRNYASLELIRIPFSNENILGFSDELIATNRARPTKSYIWWMNDPWAGFVALSAIIILLGLIALVILLYQWNRWEEISDYEILLFLVFNGKRWKFI